MSGFDYYRCNNCESDYFVPLDDPNRHLLKKTMRCPNYRECKGRIHLKASTNLRINLRLVIDATSLFQATVGLGLPNERKCSPNDVKKALLGSRIKAVHLENAADPKKSLIMSLTLDNGKVFHLSTSTRGAIIYKVTEDL